MNETDKQAINEIVEPKQLPEAPASATVKVQSPFGFEWLFTMRDEHASSLTFKMAAMEKKWLSEGFTPLTQFANKKPVISPVPPVTPQNAPQKQCMLHGAMMEHHISQRTGKPFYSHQTEGGSWCYGTR